MRSSRVTTAPLARASATRTCMTRRSSRLVAPSIVHSSLDGCTSIFPTMKSRSRPNSMGAACAPGTIGSLIGEQSAIYRLAALPTIIPLLLTRTRTAEPRGYHEGTRFASHGRNGDPGARWLQRCCCPAAPGSGRPGHRQIRRFGPLDRFGRTPNAGPHSQRRDRRVPQFSKQQHAWRLRDGLSAICCRQPGAPRVTALYRARETQQ